MSTYIYNGGVVQPIYDATGTKITGMQNPDGTTSNVNSADIVTVLGIVSVGNRLTAQLAPGWSCSSFTWSRDGVTISGATTNTYLVQDIDAGKVIRAVPVSPVYTGATAGTTATILTNARPAFMQASPLGHAGSFRSVSAHNSVNMYRAASDLDTVELTISNVLLWESLSLSEAFPSDNANLLVNAQLFSPTFPYVETTRTFTASFSIGATGGTLSANAPGSTLEYCVFSSGETRWIRLTGGSTAVTWDKPLTATATATPRTRQTTSRGNFLFNGSTTGILEGGKTSVLKSEITGLSIKKDDPVYVNFYITKQGGGSFLLPGNQSANWQDNLANGLLEAFNDSATNSSGTRFGSPPWYAISGGTTQFRALSLKGKLLSNNSYRPVTVIGDSIGSNPQSWVQQWLHANKVPYVNLCKAGENTSSFLAGSEARSQVLDRGMVLCEMGRNGWTLAAMQTFWAYLRSQGFTRIIQVLPPPVTTSTNGFIDEANQTQDTATQGVNASVVALVGQSNGPDAIIDTYTPTRGTDPLKWAAGFTDDGVHPNTTTGIPAIITYLNAQNYIQLFNN